MQWLGSIAAGTTPPLKPLHENVSGALLVPNASNGRVYSEPKSEFQLSVLVAPNVCHGPHLIAAELTCKLKGASL